jgi:hypothetical protein
MVRTKSYTQGREFGKKPPRFYCPCSRLRRCAPTCHLAGCARLPANTESVGQIPVSGRPMIFELSVIVLIESPILADIETMVG